MEHLEDPAICCMHTPFYFNFLLCFFFSSRDILQHSYSWQDTMVDIWKMMRDHDSTNIVLFPNENEEVFA